MLRALILTLALSTGAHASDIDIETLSDSEFALPRVAELGDKNYEFNLAGSRISIEIRDRVLHEKREMLLDWVAYSAETVSIYYGRFPVGNVHINVQVTGGKAVRFGRAFSGENPRIRVVVGENITAEALRKDWIMVHEMVHLAMADVPPQHAWLLEGLATYVESIARAQRKHLSEEFVWLYFFEYMPKGLPQSGDRGLDFTPTWGRTYWGGAIFCLLADIEIRKRSNNRLSLRDALRGVLDDGMSMHNSVLAMDVFESGDRATGLDVLVPLYEKMKAAPHPVDLDAIWESLGVDLIGEQVVYDDSAPLAHVRKAFFNS